MGLCEVLAHLLQILLHRPEAEVLAVCDRLLIGEIGGLEVLLDLRNGERSPALHAQQDARGPVLGARHGGAWWSATLFVDNLTNNIVLLDPNPQFSLQDSAYSRYVVTRPLTAGIDISYSFR